MKRILKLTESELTNLIKRIIKEEKKVNDIRIWRLVISGKNSKALVQSYGENEFTEDFPSCNTGSPNCFKQPSSLKDGVYKQSNFTGVVFLTYENKTYKCMLGQPCQPT